MISKYTIFCKVIECGNFTKTAESLGYSQSAVSQAVKGLELEMGTQLVNRDKTGITLTADGWSYYPYFQTIKNAEEKLERKKREMEGLENSHIRIGTFTSVSRNILPEIMHKFKEKYPHVQFILQQGEYTSIARWLREGSVDLGFINTQIVKEFHSEMLYEDDMVAVLPKDHPMAFHDSISLEQLAAESLILLDEGEHSLPMNMFQQYGLNPKVEYTVYDDYSILAMVQQGLGVSLLYRKAIEGFEENVVLLPVKEGLNRSIGLAWKNWETLPLASRKFGEFMIRYIKTKSNNRKGADL